MEKSDALIEAIDSHVGEVRTESLDMSFGELLNLHRDKELVIQPEYQRLFRWSNDQKSRLVESVLLELPIPPIFLIENEDGVLELIDGLHRTISVFQFLDSDVLDSDILDLPPLTLSGCDIVKDLNDLTFEALPRTLKLRIKRSSVRAIIIKRQSNSFLKYEMFKRLNTGGALLSPQEIRNCSSRMVGTSGVTFYSFLQECAQHEDFKKCIEKIGETSLEQKGDEELVLRFFALKNGILLYRGSVRNFLDDYMEKVLVEEESFDYSREKESFNAVFSFIANTMGENAFVKYKDGLPQGNLAPAYFEAVSLGVFRNIDNLTDEHYASINSIIKATLESADFRQNTGPSANNIGKLNARMSIIEDKIREYIGE